MKRSFFMIIGGCATGFTNDNFTPDLSCDQTVWKSALRLESTDFKLTETIDPFDNEPTINSINIELIDIDHFFNEIFTQKDNFCTILTSQIDRADTISDTFTVQSGDSLASSGDIWINNECISYTRSGNTLTIVKRAKYNSIKQTHEVEDSNGNLSYIYDVMPEITGRIVNLYKKNEDGTEILIYKGSIEPNIQWQEGLIVLPIVSFVSTLKNVSMIRYQKELTLSHYTFIRPEQGFIQYQTTETYEDGTIRRGWVKILTLNYASIENLLFSLSYRGGAQYVDQISGDTVNSNFDYEYQDGHVAIKSILASPSGNKRISIRFDFNGAGSEDILKILGFEENYIEIVRATIDDPIADTVVAPNPPAAWAISYFSFGSWIETTTESTIFIDESVIANETIILKSDNQFGNQGSTCMALNIESFIDNIATLSLESVDANHSYFSDNNESKVYLGKVIHGDFWNVIDGIDGLSDRLHPEFYQESDFDLASFKKLPSMTVFNPVWYLFGKVNLLDIIKNVCKLSNFILKVSSTGTVSVQSLAVYTTKSIELEHGNYPQVSQIAPLTTIKYVDENETLIHEERLQSKVLNYHTYPKVDQIKLLGMHNYDWGYIHSWITEKAMGRFLIFARSLFQISFACAESLVLANTYTIDNDLIPSFLSKVIITKKTYNLKKGYEYEGIMLGWNMSYYAPCCWVTSYNSGTYVGTCTSINNFTQSTDLYNDLTYLDPTVYDLSEIHCLAYNASNTYIVHVQSIDIVAKTITFKSSDTLPTAPFIVSFPQYADIVADMINFAFICDEDDRKISNDIVGMNWD